MKQTRPPAYRSESVENLRSDPDNVRRHSDRNVGAVAASLRRFGQQKPIVVTPDLVVVAGNATLEAARRLGWETLDVVVTDLRPEDVPAFAVADNRTAELAEWDYDALAALLREMDGDDFPAEMNLELLLASVTHETPYERHEREGGTPEDLARASGRIVLRVFDLTRVSEVRDLVAEALADLVDDEIVEIE